MARLLAHFATDKSAASSIEYAFLASLIAMVILGTLGIIGTRLQQPFNSASNGLN